MLHTRQAVLKTLTTLLLTTLSFSSQAAKSPSIPADLMFKNKPIDAVCFNEIPKIN